MLKMILKIFSEVHFFKKYILDINL